MSQFVQDRTRLDIKQIVWIDVSCIVLKKDPEGKRLTWLSQGQLPNGHDYGTFLPEIGEPVINLDDLRWFLHEDRTNLFYPQIRHMFWSQNEYPEIELTLPKAIRYVLAKGAKYVDPESEAEQKRLRKAKRVASRYSKDLAPMEELSLYDSLALKELRLLAKIEKITDNESIKTMPKAEIITLLTKKDTVLQKKR